MVKLLDCTLRDGGYYTNWNYSEHTLKEYFKHLSKLPVDFVEIGYRSLRSDQYLGELFYTPIYVLQLAHELMPGIRKAIMLDEKDTSPGDLSVLLDPCREWISMVRLAVAPDRFDKGLALAKAIRAKGFLVAMNLMHASVWGHDALLVDRVKAATDDIDYLYIVDSYGALKPDDVRALVEKLKPGLRVPLGFHGHNNLELALINSLTAIECGCEIIDTTVTGMGRGAGNLKTELALIVLKEKYGFDLDFESLSSLTSLFQSLHKEYEWGTNIAYMLSGTYSIPQKEVMEQLNKRRHFIGSIIREWGHYVPQPAREASDGHPCLHLQPKSEVVIITGGGESAVEQSAALKRFIDIELSAGRRVSLIHASTRYADIFTRLQNLTQYFCLVGKEGKRLEAFAGSEELMRRHRFIIPSAGSAKNTYLPAGLRQSVFHCNELLFVPGMDDSPLALAIQGAMDLGARTVYLYGFDGYRVQYDTTQLDLFNENEMILEKAADLPVELISLTPTRYQHVKQVSIFHLITKSPA